MKVFVEVGGQCGQVGFYQGYYCFLGQKWKGIILYYWFFYLEVVFG